jgi:dCTP deaminase
VLSSVQILQRIGDNRIKISPFDEKHLQPVSYDVHLSRHGLRMPYYPDIETPLLDLGAGAPWTVPIEFPPRDEAKQFYLRPLRFVLGALIEDITLDATIAARLEGRSTLGRAGLMIHVTAGLVDPRWSGPLTVEIFNVSPSRIRLWEGMPIGQVTFEELTAPVKYVYGSPELNSHYTGSTGVVGSAGLADSQWRT